LMKVDSGEIYQKKKKKKLSNIPVLAKPWQLYLTHYMQTYMRFCCRA
jgi:hypothetical protein